MLPSLDGVRALAAPIGGAESVLAQRYPFTLPDLGYPVDAVEPAIDAMTMSIHHDRHHAAYVTTLNRLVEAQPALQEQTLRDLLLKWPELPAQVRDGIRNNAGGHANHSMLWETLAPGGDREPGDLLAAAVTRDFGSMSACLGALKTAGMGQFGSGWTWLVRDAQGTLLVRATPNQDTPLSERVRPILGIDVWEHAYYLKYQHRRADYLDAVLARINWTAVTANFLAA
jgi:Fe-Mn family superoxide dismutase